MVEEISKDILIAHAEAEAKIRELQKVDTNTMLTFEEWFKQYNMGGELTALNKRRGRLVELMIAYTNLDILKELKDIKSLLRDNIGEDKEDGNAPKKRVKG